MELAEEKIAAAVKCRETDMFIVARTDAHRERTSDHTQTRRPLKTDRPKPLGGPRSPSPGEHPEFLRLLRI